MRYFYLLVFILSCFTVSLAQSNITISGYCKELRNGEPLIGAVIYDVDQKKNTTTNQFGFYSITLDASKSIKLVYSYIGFKKAERLITSKINETQNVFLEEFNVLKEVEVIGEKTPPIQQTTKMSSVVLTQKQIKSIPAIFGEVDLLKVLQLIPGIKGGTEGTSGIYVRGGGPDQNLFLLDQAPLYNVSHLFGFFSTFNADAINTVEVMKGGFPARYSGRLSSVIDIVMKDGNKQKWEAEGGIGLISSRLTVQGPLIKDKASIIVSGRRTYIDYLVRPIIKSSTNDGSYFGYYFYDFNSKINFKVNDKNHVYLSTYFGDDRFYGKSTSGFDKREQQIFKLGWGNQISTLRWNTILSPKMFINNMVIFSRYDFYINIANDKLDKNNKIVTDVIKFNSGVQDVGFKSVLDYFPSTKHAVKTGVNYTYHDFNAGASQIKIQDGNGGDPFDFNLNGKRIYASEVNLFVEDDWEMTSKFKANLGLNYTLFVPGKKAYQSLQPRLSGRFLLNPSSSLKTSYTFMQQNIHLLTNSNIGLPTDLWVPATDRILPQKAHQWALGYTRSFKDNMYDFNAETYYKIMNNLIEYKEGANFLNSSGSWEDKVSSGTGTSKGFELMLRKNKGRFTGWIGYTLSWTDRQFEDINFGKIFPFKYDRRHDVSLVGSMKLTDVWELNGTWVYSSGNAISLQQKTFATDPISSLNFNPNQFNNYSIYYGEKNSYRIPSYHRMDIGISHIKKRNIWNFSIYNVYNRKNIFFINKDRNEAGEEVFVQVSLFPIIPTITWNFKF
jgi:hypothetical protein